MIEEESDLAWLDRIARIAEKYGTFEVPIVLEYDVGILLGIDLDDLPYMFDGGTKRWKRINIG